MGILYFDLEGARKTISDQITVIELYSPFGILFLHENSWMIAEYFHCNFCSVYLTQIHLQSISFTFYHKLAAQETLLLKPTVVEFPLRVSLMDPKLSTLRDITSVRMIPL